jgi:hypothetical protein
VRQAAGRPDRRRAVALGPPEPAHRPAVVILRAEPAWRLRAAAPEPQRARPVLARPVLARPVLARPAERCAASPRAVDRARRPEAAPVWQAVPQQAAARGRPGAVPAWQAARAVNPQAAAPAWPAAPAARAALAVRLVSLAAQMVARAGALPWLPEPVTEPAAPPAWPEERVAAQAEPVARLASSAAQAVPPASRAAVQEAAQAAAPERAPSAARAAVARRVAVAVPWARLLWADPAADGPAAPARLPGGGDDPSAPPALAAGPAESCRVTRPIPRRTMRATGMPE